jgi:hypothetical protein
VNETARLTPVFWEPAWCSSVIEAVALPAKFSAKDKQFRLGDLPGRVSLLRRRGVQHVLLQADDCTIQLAVSGESILKPVRLLTDLVVEKQALRAPLDAIGRFNALCAGDVCQQARSVAPSAIRLRMVLQALDGYLAGASQREMATALFGSARVKRDWRDPRGHLRDVVRRAIRRARDLMEGEYRSLLR